LPKAVVGLTLLAAGFYVVTRLGLGGRQAQRPHAVSLSAPGGEAAKQPVYDSLYKYTALDIDGVETKLSKFEGKVSLIVNTATY